MAARTTPNTRHTRGTFIVVVLGVIFIALIAALIFTTGKKPPQQASTPSESLSVLPMRIRLRTEPTAKAPVVATATNGEKLVVLDDRGAWVKVQDEDGVAGWAERNSLERTSERERRLAHYEAIKKLPALGGLVTDRTPLYAGPGIFYPLIGELPAQTQVKIYTRDHDFYAIDHDGAVAYADVDAIDVSSAGTRQLEVRTDTAPAQTDTTASTATQPPAPLPTASQAPAPEMPAPQPAQAPAREDHAGVYAAVPAGGTQPEEIDRVIPRYPPVARRAGIQGPVVVRGIVRRDGTIDNVEVIKDLPYGLGDAAADAVRRWRFRPATVRGEPIDVYYTVTVNFRLR
jgi:protein TonB